MSCYLPGKDGAERCGMFTTGFEWCMQCQIFFLLRNAIIYSVSQSCQYACQISLSIAFWIALSNNAPVGLSDLLVSLN